MGINSVAFNYLVDTQLCIEFSHNTSMDVFDKIITSNVVMEDMPIYKTISAHETIGVSFILSNEMVCASTHLGQIMMYVDCSLNEGKAHSNLQYSELLQLNLLTETLCIVDSAIANILIPVVSSNYYLFYKTYLNQKSASQIFIDNQLDGLLINISESADSFVVCACDAKMISQFSLLANPQKISLTTCAPNFKVGRYRTILDIENYDMSSVGDWNLSTLYFDEKE